VTSPTPHWLPRLLTRLSGTVTVTTAGAVLLLGSPVPDGGPAAAVGDSGAADTSSTELALVAADPHRWPGHPGRRVVRYRVRPGDTATGLAVRFHAWTDELLAINHLGRSGALYVGQRIRVPVVTAAVRRHRAHHRVHHPRAHHRASHPRRHHRAARPWTNDDASRARVRRLVTRAATHHGVDPGLALAVAWQESGWQQHRYSSAGAIGVMQVLPGTASWMSSYAGRRLNPYGLHDNITAGVLLLRVLRGQTGPRTAIAAYYQGLGAVQRHGTYRSTRAYVRNVVALRKRLHRGWDPA
jgi:LysM repeat protein